MYFGFAEVPAPSTEDFRKRLARAAPSAPGPDGLSFAHWRAAGPGALVTMQEAFFWISGGGKFGPSWNHTTTCQGWRREWQAQRGPSP